MSLGLAASSFSLVPLGWSVGLVAPLYYHVGSLGVKVWLARRQVLAFVVGVVDVLSVEHRSPKVQPTFLGALSATAIGLRARVFLVLDKGVRKTSSVLSVRDRGLTGSLMLGRLPLFLGSILV